MANKILVCYASTYGSTENVAGAVGEVLSGAGLEVDVKATRNVRDLSPYHAVVLGAPLYFGGIHKDALAFLTRQAEALGKLPVAFFALGPLQDDKQQRRDGRAAMDSLLAKFPGLKPVGCEVFGGKYDPAKLKLGHRLVAALPASPLHGQAATDVRDWQGIRAWARSLAHILEPATA